MSSKESTQYENNSKQHVKLPPLGSIFQKQTSSLICNTPASVKAFTPYVLPYISPTMSDGGFQSVSFPGKFAGDFDDKTGTYSLNRLNFSTIAQPLPLSPQNYSPEQFTQLYAPKNSDMYFHGQQRSSNSRYSSTPINYNQSNQSYGSNSRYSSTPINYNQSCSSYVDEQISGDKTDHQLDKKSFVSKTEGLGLKTLKGAALKMDIKHSKITKKTKDKAKSKFAFILHSTNSYSTNKDPLIDNEQLARQKRRRTDGKVVSILEKFYSQKSRKPNKGEKIEMSEETGLTVAQVQVWFQNRRSRDSKNEKQQATKHQLLAE